MSHAWWIVLSGVIVGVLLGLVAWGLDCAFRWFLALFRPGHRR